MSLSQLFSLSLCSSLGNWDHSPSDEDKEDLALGTHILHGRRACPNLSPKNIVEDLGHVLLGLRCEGVACERMGGEVERV